MTKGRLSAFFIGQEICYSGSYGGLKCGDIVKDTSDIYQFEGYPTQITGFRTEQSNSEPAAGHGDSGGPGNQLVSTSSGLKRMAVRRYRFSYPERLRDKL